MRFVFDESYTYTGNVVHLIGFCILMIFFLILSHLQKMIIIIIIIIIII